MLVSYCRSLSYQTELGMQVPTKKIWQEEVYKSLALFSHHICQEFPSANLPRYIDWDGDNEGEGLVHQPRW